MPSPRVVSTLLFCLALAPSAWSLFPLDVELPPDRPAFQEVWAYLSAGEESSWDNNNPVTDLAYFSGSLNSWGELTGLPNPARLKDFSARKHLVIAILENTALTHLVLHPGFPVRATLLDDLTTAAGPYDGLQLDFESITTRDKESFWSFLAELKQRLGSKVLSVAVPARTAIIDDAYNYRVLDRTVDRVVVMAYDEHWSGSAPGPVASLEWGRRVVSFAQSTIGPSRLVLGIPFYARAWADKALSRAYRARALAPLMLDLKPGSLRRTGGIPSFEYEESVKVKVFFDDRESHQTRIDLYASSGVRNLAFWRLGQETPDFWSLIRLSSRSGF